MKKNNKRERPLQTQLSKWTRPVLAEEQTRTTPHTNDDECVRVTMFAFIFFVEYLYKNWGDAKLFVSVCVFMYVLSARTIRVVLVVRGVVYNVCLCFCCCDAVITGNNHCVLIIT